MMVIGIDLGKNSCSVAGMDATGSVTFRRRVSRAGLIEIVRRHAGCVAAMEACCGAHHLGRLFAEEGHEVRLMSPEYIRPIARQSGWFERDDQDERHGCRGDGEHRGGGRRDQGFWHPDCRGASISGGFDCRAAWGSAGSLAALDGGAAPVALDVELEDGRVVDEPVDRGERHRGIGEDPVPFAEGLVGGDQDGAALVAGADQLEEPAGLGLVLGDVGEVVEDQQVVLVEPWR
jgi:hypothetical protein